MSIENLDLIAAHRRYVVRLDDPASPNLMRCPKWLIFLAFSVGRRQIGWNPWQRRDQSSPPGHSLLPTSARWPSDETRDTPREVQEEDAAIVMTLSPSCHHLEPAHGIRAGTDRRARRTRVDLWRTLACAIFGLSVVLSPSNSASASFTIVALPDTQNYTETSPIPAQQTQWIIDNAATRDIAFVTHLGDVVDVGSQTLRWANVSNAMSLLDPHVPYSVVQGNHDPDPPSPGSCPCSIFLSYFGESRYVGFSWYGGKMPGVDRPSFYQFFDADGVRFLHLGLQLGYIGTGVIEWARGIIAANPGLPVVVSTHAYLDVGGYGYLGSTLWTDFIATEPQIFMVLNGHFLEPTNPPGDAEFSQISMNNAGLPVIEMLANYQQRPNGGDGWLRLIEIDRTASEVRFSTYSPSLGAFETDTDSEFSLSFDIEARLPQCNDGIDNDLDGNVDFPADTECTNYAGASEGVPNVPGMNLWTATGLALFMATVGAMLVMNSREARVRESPDRV